MRARSRARHGRAEARAQPHVANDPATDDPTASERWRGVWFRYASRVARRPAARESRRERDGAIPRQFVESALLALRFEALIRTAESPERYARRLAWRLADGRATEQRLLRPLPRKGSAGLPRDDVEAAQAEARLAAPAAARAGAAPTSSPRLAPPEQATPPPALIGGSPVESPDGALVGGGRDSPCGGHGSACTN
jgi:hypothetical protein